ncbi:MAG: GNAT family N-acetyltransferase, partial [Clostridia bacterium]|nr:GNAT family N-acetyltransferase [Clostridia bacterium]
MLKKGDGLIKDFDKRDSSSLISLWQICFGDEKEYIESFFENFSDRMKVGVYRQDGKIVSALYCLPAQLVFEKTRVDAWYVYAVGTLPEYRKRGYAGELIDEVKNLEDIRQALFLTPSSEKNRSFYAKLGFEDRFFSSVFDFEKRENSREIRLCKRTNEDLFALRERYLGEYPFVSWDEKHLEFALKRNTLIAYERGEAAGYIHFEKEADDIIVDEIAAKEGFWEDILNEACDFFGVKKIKVFAQNAENCCKISKGMIYCKFDSMEKVFSKNQI